MHKRFLNGNRALSQGRKQAQIARRPCGQPQNRVAVRDTACPCKVYKAGQQNNSPALPSDSEACTGCL